MLNYTLKRVYSAFLVILAVTAITFFVLNTISGNAAMLSLGTDASPEQLAALEQQLGLDAPWYMQYLRWLLSLIKLDLGLSLLYGEEVRSLIIQRLPLTLSLALLSTIMSIVIALPLGVLSAAKKNCLPDILARSIMQAGTAIPAFWISLMLILNFALERKWFPVSGFVPPSHGPLPYLKSIFLPSLVLALAEAGPLLRALRTGMLQVLSQDYIQVLRARGVPELKLYIKYALRSSLTAPISMLGIQFGKLLGGTTIVESIFSLPGLGRLILVAVEQRDIPLLQGCIIFITTAVVLSSLTADLIIAALNPRLRLSGGSL